MDGKPGQYDPYESMDGWPQVQNGLHTVSLSQTLCKVLYIQWLANLVLPIILWSRHYNYSHYKKGEAESQKS
jgi:hypothetical protein